MNTLEGNKLIAEFMGYKFHNDRFYLGDEYNTSFHFSILAYNEQWERLMPVIEKIGNIHYPNYYNGRPRDPEQEGEWDDFAWPRTFGMRDNEELYMVRFNASQLFSAKTLIEAAWLAVIDFIQWYNQNTKP